MTKVICGIVTKVTMQGTLQEVFHCKRSVEGVKRLYLVNESTRHAVANFPSESAADLMASPLPPAPSVTVDRLTADMDVCWTG